MPKIRLFQKYAGNNLDFFCKFSCNLFELLYNYICVIRYIDYLENSMETFWKMTVLYIRKEFVWKINFFTIQTMFVFQDLCLRIANRVRIQLAD